MSKIIFPYGIVSGAIIISSMILGLTIDQGQGTLAASQLVGYLIMIVALSAIFLGIKRYRDQDLGGVITFAKACAVGIGIAAVAGVIYVATWEAYLILTDHAFIDQYAESMIANKKAKGLSDVELQALGEQMDEMKNSYADPFYRLPITFLEIFPVGLLIALISAGLLRNSKFMPVRTV